MTIGTGPVLVEPPPAQKGPDGGRILRRALLMAGLIGAFLSLIFSFRLDLLLTGFMGTGTTGTDTAGTDTSMTWPITGSSVTDHTSTDTMASDTSGTGVWSTDTSGTSATSATSASDDRDTLHFNGWIERRGLARPDPLRRATVRQSYTFTADLGYWRAEDAFEGATSFAPGPDLEQVIENAPETQVVLGAYARPILLGRGLELLGGRLNVEVWRGGVWQKLDATDGMVPFDIDLQRMRRAKTLASPETDDLRFAGLRFGVSATRSGCAAVALSIWNEEKTLPLDNVVFPVTVGDADCAAQTSEAGERRDVAGLTRLLTERPDATFDAALHVFEYALSGGTPGGVAIYVPARPDSDCTHYAWETTRAISSVVSTSGFATSLERARRNNDYAGLAETLRDHLFPGREPDRKCGDAGALRHLVQLAAASTPKLFVRLIGAENGTLFLPVGIVFMARDGKGQRMFAKAPLVVQSLPRETYRVAGCISALAFAVPPKLAGVGPVAGIEPSPLFRPLGSIADIDAFMTKSDGKPVTLLLLAHHGEGLIYFDDPAVQWDVSFLNRSFEPGSVAILSTCNAGNVSPSQMRLARDLNEAGIDAMLLSSFDVKPTPGIALARHMAAELVTARQQAEPLELLQIYQSARQKTVDELAKTFGTESAEGLMSEFLLAGNGGIRICGKEN